MASPNIGDRVRWIHNEPSADPEELHGKVTNVSYSYLIRWDDGTEEWVEDGDIELDTGA